MVSVKKFVILFGLLIFVFILSSINLESVLEILFLIKFDFFIISLLLLFIILILKAFKWKLILKSQNTEISLLNSLKYFLIGFFFSSFTPGRIGDVTRATYLSQSSSLALAVSSVVLDRVVDIVLLVIFASLALLAFFFTYNLIVLPFEILILIGVLIFAVIFLLFKEKYLRIILRPAFNLIIPENFKKKIKIGFSDFFSSIKLIFQNKSEFLLAVITGIVIWIISIIFSYSLALSINLNIPFEFMFLLYPIITLADILPISVSGLGTRDAMIIFLFSFIYFTPEQAVSFSILLFLVGYVFIALIGYLLFLSEPIELKKMLQENF
ncbi:MAG: lysylphosphatidylglycerol synthase transmembrane domain-containing protein [Candidatus Diapherotrites archaeon]